MSEYQYYEFQALDRPLDETELRQLRSLSTRASITPTSFVSVYHFGDFKGNPRVLMEKFFDAIVYVANWGWKHRRKRFVELRKRDVNRVLAAQTASSSRGPWRLSQSPALCYALPNAYFAKLGLPSLVPGCHA